MIIFSLLTYFGLVHFLVHYLPVAENIAQKKTLLAKDERTTLDTPFTYDCSYQCIIIPYTVSPIGYFSITFLGGVR